MRPVLRPGLRLHRDPSDRAALVDRGVVYWLDEVTASLLGDLDGLVEEAALLLHRADTAEAEHAWAALREARVVVDVEAAARLVVGLEEPVRREAAPEVTSLVAHDPVTAERSWGRRRAARVEVVGEGAVTRTLVDLVTRAGVGGVLHCEAAGVAVEPDLSVLTHDHEPAADTVVRLMRTGTPHLVAGMRGGEAVVGPFVLPGSTPCLRCLDLSRSAADPGWAALRQALGTPDPAVPLTGRPASAVVTTAAAALAAADVLAHVEGLPPATAATTATFGVHRPLPTTQHWPRQPACGCTWDTELPAQGQ